MSKILEAIAKLATQTYSDESKLEAIRKYTATGDEALLTGLQLIPRSPAAYDLAAALPDPDAWTGEAARALRLAHLTGVRVVLEIWLKRYCCDQNAGWQHFDGVLRELKSAGLSDQETRAFLKECHVWDAQALQPTPAGLRVLEGADAEILAQITQKYGGETQLSALLAHSQPERLEKFLAAGLQFQDVSSTYAQVARANPGRFAAKAFAVFKNLQPGHGRLNLIAALAEAAPAKYLDHAYAELSAYLRQDRIEHDVLARFSAEFLLKHGLPDALELTCKWMGSFDDKNAWNAPFQRELLMKWGLENAPKLVQPMAEACARCPASAVALLGLKQWKQQGIGDTADRYHAALRRVLAGDDSSAVVAAVAEAREFDLQRTQEDIWPLMLHKSRPVRGAAARALAGLGFAAAGARAARLLAHKKPDVRQAAVLLLSQIGSEEARGILKQHLDTEENDDVRDSLLVALENSGGGVTLSPKEREERIARTLAKSKAPPAPWIQVDALVFQKHDGRALTADEVLYLLIRQSRCKEMRADLEAKPLYAELDRKANADAALALVHGFLGTVQDAAERWVLALAALTGDDRLVPVLRKAILEWAEKSRGKLAEYGAQALALLGTETALMVVDSLSIRFRSKNKNIGQAAAEAFAAAAEARGVTVEELGDLVVPWLGFEPGRPRLIEAGKTQVEARIDPEFKLGLRDVKTGKAMTKLPAGTPAEVQAEFKTLTGTLQEAVKAQLLRIETLLVRQFRWPVPRWRAWYLAHPLLRPFTQRLVWGWRDGAGELRHTFRALDDASLTDLEDHTVTLPDEGSVSLVHPLDLGEETRSAWLQHLADYEIAPPFPQLARPVVRVKPEEAAWKFGRQVHGTDLNAMTFRSRAEKLGWSRGSVADAGMITSYRKVFSGAGIEAFLSLDGMYIGAGMDSNIQLGDLCFVKTGAVKVGSYSYDEPAKEDDPRLIPFGDVPAVPFSEVMGDLIKIAGAKPEPETT